MNTPNIGQPLDEAGSADLRVFVVGPVGLLHSGGFLDTATLPGRQGRALFALLVTERHHAIARDAIADRFWGDQPPDAWSSAISALVSKIRRMLEAADPTGAATVQTAFGAHQMHLPAAAWVDLEMARTRIDQAEAELRSGSTEAAWADAHVAWSIATRDFLTGEHAPWVEEQRRELSELAARALACLADVWQGRGEYQLAARCAAGVIRHQPFREDGYRQMMRAQAAAGNRAEAVRTFEDLRRKLHAELGVAPDSTTTALWREIT